MDDLFAEMEEEQARGVFTLLGRPVTAYALCLACALALGIALLICCCKKRRLKKDTALNIALLGLPLGLVCARLFYCLVRIEFFDSLGLENILYLWDGGFGIWGSIGGAVLAAVIVAKASGQPLSALLDAMAAPGALIIALCRFAEYFSGEGRGPVLENSALCFFPIGIYNPEYEEWELAVLVMEGVAALVILFVTLRRERRSGDTARLMILLYSACQVVLESLRRDDALRWMFVRVSQLTAVIVLALLILFSVLRKAREKRLRGKRTLLWFTAFLASIGLCIWMEFAQDKSPDLPSWLCYVIMAAACGVMGTAAYQIVMKKEE